MASFTLGPVVARGSEKNWDVSVRELGVYWRLFGDKSHNPATGKKQTGPTKEKEVSDLPKGARGTRHDDSETSLAGAQTGGCDVELPPRVLGREVLRRPRWIPEEPRPQARAAPDRQVTWDRGVAQDPPRQATGGLHRDYYDLLTVANSRPGGSGGRKGRPNRIEWGPDPHRDPGVQAGAGRPVSRASSA
ncbi:hypothetical protein EYF80_010019 [Liparis tanakae]|uniref:Uncharacterized protein n=1 Tax=Liparis tanakae TaxID=230148 RepID=A0A4Z2IPG7_9TELE|nr:hypothetical protein EYF80_010019 [Liparis tanakae]